MRTPPGSIACRSSRSSSALAGAFAIAIIVMGGAALDGCAATAGASVDRLGPDRFALKCRGPLAQCLVQVDELCQGTRFTVESASDTRDYVGPHGMTEHESRSSEATIRCGSRGTSIFGAGVGAGVDASRTARVDGAHAADTTATPATMTTTATATAGAVSAPPSSPPPTSATDARRACVPGATQTCVGPGACRGGQSCLSDGSGFSVCDCGGARAAAPSSADAPGSSSSPSLSSPSSSSSTAPSSPPP